MKNVSLRRITRNATLRKLWREWAKPALVVLLVTSALRSALADWNDVPTGSMKPTIMEGDRIFVNKLAYDLKVPFTAWHVAEWADPKRGDIVVFWFPNDPDKSYVKRVIGLPGETVEIRSGKVLVNGQELKNEREVRVGDRIVLGLPATTLEILNLVC